MVEKTGRCLCGAVTWATEAETLWSGHCHCESCRRATASPMTSFFGVPRGSVIWTGTLGVVKTSGGTVQRQFCPNCGTQITYQADFWPGETHLYVGTLDDPTQFEPQAHFHYAEKLPWLQITDDLPKYESSSEAGDPLP